MDDKTMLELAAKAAGIGGMHYPKGGWLINGSFDIWNPLTDDGDALRLAVKLELIVRCYGDSIIVDGCGREWFEEHDMSDRYVATRRAIVRAAAEIGKGMGVG